MIQVNSGVNNYLEFQSLDKLFYFSESDATLYPVPCSKNEGTYFFTCHVLISTIISISYLFFYCYFCSTEVDLLHSIIYLILSYLIVSHSILSQYILSHSISSYLILSHVILSYLIISIPIPFYLILHYTVLFYPIFSYATLSHRIMSYPIVSYSILFHPFFILFYLILFCFIMSYSLQLNSMVCYVTLPRLSRLYL